MFTIEKGQTVDFRGPKIPSYIIETKETAHKLADNLYAKTEVSVTKELPDKTKVPTKQTGKVLNLNKLKRIRNATHQEG
jgi:hypothetical protein